MIRVTQLSDCHFTTSDEPTYGGLGYNTNDAWEAIFRHAFEESNWPDLVVITGDVTDRGQSDEYELARMHLGKIQAPVNTVIGNHDRHNAFHGFISAELPANSSNQLGNWLFIFTDSNLDGREVGTDGVLQDKPNRIMACGELGEAEVLRIEQTILDNTADHVFIWLHHPPLAPGRYSAPTYNAELARLLARHPRVRGIAGGHMHTDTVDELEGRPVFTCPAFAINVDLHTGEAQPPGYRTYEFGNDGSVMGTCHFIDDPRWPRRQLPEAVRSYWEGFAPYADALAAIAQMDL